MGKRFSQQAVQRGLRSRWMFLGVGLAGAAVSVLLGMVLSFDQGYQDDPYALLRTDSAPRQAATSPKGPSSRSAHPPTVQPPAMARPPTRPAPASVHGPNKVISGPQGPTFDGRPIKPVRTIKMTVTAYSPDARSCGEQADGITASGYSVWTNGMKLVAADTTQLPFGSILTIPGYDQGQPVPVLDRGGAIEGNRLDVLYPTHEAALNWGVRDLNVTLWEYAD